VKNPLIVDQLRGDQNRSKIQVSRSKGGSYRAALTDGIPSN